MSRPSSGVSALLGATLAGAVTALAVSALYRGRGESGGGTAAGKRSDDGRGATAAAHAGSGSPRPPPETNLASSAAESKVANPEAHVAPRGVRTTPEPGATLMAGFSSEPLVPPDGSHLTGFIFRMKKPCTGVDDPGLSVRAMVCTSCTCRGRDRGDSRSHAADPTGGATTSRAEAWAGAGAGAGAGSVPGPACSVCPVSVLLSFDLLAIGEPAYRAIKAGVRASLPAACRDGASIVCVATHTHSAPPLVHLEGCGDITEAFVRHAVEAASAATVAAWAARQAVIGIRTAQVEAPGVSYNRRRVLEDGTVFKGPALPPGARVTRQGATDELLSVVAFVGHHDRVLGSFVHFSCHPVVCCCATATPDYPGLLRKTVERNLRTGVCLFLQGACGNINPVVSGRDVSELPSFVAKMEAGVKTVCAAIGSGAGPSCSVRPDAGISTGHTTFPLQYQPGGTSTEHLRTAADLEQVGTGTLDADVEGPLVASFGNLMNVAPGQSVDPARLRCVGRAMAASYRRAAAAASVGPCAEVTPRPLAVAAWSFGDGVGASLGLVFLAAEVFAETGNCIRSLAGPNSITLPVGHASPIVGYLPCADDYRFGGYEVEDAWRFYGHPAPYTPSSEAGVRALASRLYRAAEEELRRRAPAAPLVAEVVDSGFSQSHDTYNGMGVASNGNVYYVLCSVHHNVPGRMYEYNPQTATTRLCGDLDSACGQGGTTLPPVSQGKSHVPFVESNGSLFFATHLGFYSIVDGKETVGIPPPGFSEYPGGHFLAYKLDTRAFTSLGVAPGGEGILSMAMDTTRGQLYGITWPSGRFIRTSIAEPGTVVDYGPVALDGEAGVGARYRTLCRCLVVVPDTGVVLFSDADGSLWGFDPTSDSIRVLHPDLFRRDYFGKYDPANPGTMAYNWRQAVWVESQRAIYGVHGNSGYLFRLDPALIGKPNCLELVTRITSEPSQRCGRFDLFSYGYLGFSLAPDGRTLTYLTGAPLVTTDGSVQAAAKASTAKGEARGDEELHAVTYHIPTGRYRDHGRIRFADGRHPTYVNSIAVGEGGWVYSMGRVAGGGGPGEGVESSPVRTDLWSVRLAAGEAETPTVA